MPVWYPLRLDSNSATDSELPGDLIAHLVRAWQVIGQVVGSCPSPEWATVKAGTQERGMNVHAHIVKAHIVIVATAKSTC